jgi:hypothetical protein
MAKDICIRMTHKALLKRHFNAPENELSSTDKPV